MYMNLNILYPSVIISVERSLSVLSYIQYSVAPSKHI